MIAEDSGQIRVWLVGLKT